MWKKLLSVFSVFVCQVFGVLFLNVCSSSLTKNPIRRLIYDVNENVGDSSYNWFSYSMCSNVTTERLINDSERINRYFYNSRNLISIVEENSLSIDDTNYSLSNVSLFKTNEITFSTNHLKFNAIDYDFFINKENDGDIVIVPVIISSNAAKKSSILQGLALNEIVEKHCNIGSKEINGIKYSFRVSGVWESGNDNSYNMMNRFYNSLEQDVIFVDTTKYPISAKGSTSCVYFIFSKSVEKNLEFVDYLNNCYDGNLKLEGFKNDMNTFFIKNYNNLKDYYESVDTEASSFGLFVFATIVAVVAYLLILFYSFWIFKKIDTEIQIFEISCIFSGHFVGLLCLKAIIKNLLFPLGYYYCSWSLLLSSVLTGALLVIMLIKFIAKVTSESNKKIEKQGEKTYLVIHFEDLSIRNASTIRIKNFITIFNNIGFEKYHDIGFFKKDRNDGYHYGIKKSNKILSYLLAPFSYCRAISKISKKWDIQFVYIYSPIPFFSSIFVNFYLHLKNINIIHDVIEFQNYSQMNLKKPGWFNVSNHFYNRFLLSKGDNVISISSYLDGYFTEKGCNSVVVPPLFEIDNAPSYEEKDILHFAYLGSPGKKDNIAMCLEGFEKLFIEKKLNFEINLYGVGANFIEKTGLSLDNSFKSIIKIHDRVSNDELSAIYKETDFVFFLRDSNKRYAKAGFPSKVVEAAFYGVPCITTNSSDLEKYFTDGENIFFSKYNKDSFVDIVLKASECFSVDSRKKLSEMAVNKFSIKTYENKVKDFVDSLLSNKGDN